MKIKRNFIFAKTAVPSDDRYFDFDTYMKKTKS